MKFVIGFSLLYLLGLAIGLIIGHVVGKHDAHRQPCNVIGYKESKPILTNVHGKQVYVSYYVPTVECVR